MKKMTEYEILDQIVHDLEQYTTHDHTCHYCGAAEFVDEHKEDCILRLGKELIDDLYEFGDID